MKGKLAAPVAAAAIAVLAVTVPAHGTVTPDWQPDWLRWTFTHPTAQGAPCILAWPHASATRAAKLCQNGTAAPATHRPAHHRGVKPWWAAIIRYHRNCITLRAAQGRTATLCRDGSVAVR